MNIDITPVGIGVFGFKAIEPKDAGLDMIVRIALLADLSRGLPADKNFSMGSALAELFGDAKTSGWGFIAPGLSANAETGSGDDVAA